MDLNESNDSLTSTGRRSSNDAFSIQSIFRATLIERYKSRHPSPMESMLWCPITNMYHSPYAMTIAHILPRKQYLTALYGDAAARDLNTEHNAMMVSAGVIDCFAHYDLALIPDIDDPTSGEQVHVWRRSEPKKYKIYIPQPHPRSMQMRIPYSDTTSYADLDGCQVAFDPSSTAHPRARYIYFHYFCCTIKKLSSKNGESDVQQYLLGRQFWGFLAYYYLPKNMLMGAVQHFGHGYETLADDYPSSKSEEAPDFTAIQIANQLLRRNGEAEGEHEERDGAEVSDEEE